MYRKKDFKVHKIKRQQTGKHNENDYGTLKNNYLGTIFIKKKQIKKYKMVQITSNMYCQLNKQHYNRQKNNKSKDQNSSITIDSLFI